MSSEPYLITREQIEKSNSKLKLGLEKSLAGLARSLKPAKINLDRVLHELTRFKIAIPSWGTLTGGTRFGKFPVPGQPRDIFEKLDDAATIHQLTGCNPTVSLHIPWDQVANLAALKRHATRRSLGFDAMNSNTFEDQPGQKLSYKFGGLAHVSGPTRQQAIRHHLEVIEIGERLGSKALSIWIGDGANFPGQADFRKSFGRYLDSLKKIYRHLPKDWTMFIEYKPFEPAFYYTVLADWGSALMAANAVGPRCKILVDLGHHLPNTNIEAVVARLISAGKLGGFHLNDSQYADDDLTAASIAPYRLFRVFHELISAGREFGRKFHPAYLIDQSHNLKDPVEALIQTTVELQIYWAKALLIDHKALEHYQETNDVLMAETEFKKAFHIDTRPLAAMARMLEGGAIAPVELFRDSGYRRIKALERAEKR